MIQNLLIVTDHSGHFSTNSLYELAVALISGNHQRNVWVCSRGIAENTDFFKGIEDAPIHAILIDRNFTYHPQGLSFHQSTLILDRNQIDAILVRLPQPLDKIFLRSLTRIVQPRKIINDPEGTIETSSKAFLITVAELCPSPTLCQNLNEAIALSQSQEIVLKPLYSYGGKGILRLSTQYFWDGDHRFPVEKISGHLRDDQFPMLAMSYLPNVSLGDKRTIVVNRKILGSAIRFPATNSWICNVAHGGHAVDAKPDEDELKIESILTPMLYEKGVIMFGFDTLVNDDGHRVLSEINSLSIGGLGPMSELSGNPILKQAADLMWEYLLSTS